MRRACWPRTKQHTIQLLSRIVVTVSPDFTPNSDRAAIARPRAAEAWSKSGDTVTTILDNNLDCVLFWFAANKLGAIWVPVNTAYKGEFLRHLVADSSAAIVVAEQDYVERMILIEGQRPRRPRGLLPRQPPVR